MTAPSAPFDTLLASFLGTPVSVDDATLADLEADDAAIADLEAAAQPASAAEVDRVRARLIARGMPEPPAGPGSSQTPSPHPSTALMENGPPGPAQAATHAEFALGADAPAEEGLVLNLTHGRALRAMLPQTIDHVLTFVGQNTSTRDWAHLLMRDIVSHATEDTERRLVYIDDHFGPCVSWSDFAPAMMIQNAGVWLSRDHNPRPIYWRAEVGKKGYGGVRLMTFTWEMRNWIRQLNTQDHNPTVKVALERLARVDQEQERYKQMRPPHKRPLKRYDVEARRASGRPGRPPRRSGILGEADREFALSKAPRR